MGDLLVGICRFSFLGRGDWAVYAGTERGSEAETQARARSAATLYASARMEARFRSFERLTLPSILAQSQGDFRFLVLTSAAMPAEYRARLARLCATDARICLLVSDAGDVGAALAPALTELSEGGRHRLVQFRLDDDDCLGIGYVEALHRAARAARDYEAFAFSMPRGLLISHYRDAGPAYYEIMRPFHGAGAALRPRGPAHNV
ncbi:glycosyltransferase [Paracoccus binzhouensis]|uniref:glycosyltransferase n=1 Tax=Paracoccus binzhouensis TaxID=2796149 RepID=UPI0018EF2560|nr:glycosyltransferase [Paracoccus binzhouensis]